jgi:hypothetical protein
MTQSLSKHTYRRIIGILALAFLSVLAVVGIVLVISRPPSPDAIAATMTALPSPTPTLTPTPTPIPTLSGVSNDLLVCQREIGRAMNARDMVGTVNLSDDHLLLLTWLSRDFQVDELDDALPGVIMGFDVALDVWQKECAVYDRVRIEVNERRGELQVRRLVVQAQMDDLLKWQAGELNDKELIARLQVTQVPDKP